MLKHPPARPPPTVPLSALAELRGDNGVQLGAELPSDCGLSRGEVEVLVVVEAGVDGAVAAAGVASRVGVELDPDQLAPLRPERAACGPASSSFILK